MIATLNFAKARQVPVTPSFSEIPAELMQIYSRWYSSYQPFENEEWPWVPVGRVGPVLILGHFNADAPLGLTAPGWAFGYAKIPEAVYRQLSEDFHGRIDELISKHNPAEHGDLSITICDESPPQPDDSIRATLQKLLTFPCPQTDLVAVDKVLAEHSQEPDFISNLPRGWGEAVQAVHWNNPLVDLNTTTINRTYLDLIPSAFASEHSIVPCGLENGAIFAVTPYNPTSTQGHRITTSWKSVRPSTAEHLRLNLVLGIRMSRDEVEQRTAARTKPTGFTTPGWGTSSGIKAPVASIANIRVKVNLSRAELGRYEIGGAISSDDLLLRVALFQAIQAGASDLHIDLAAGSGRFRVRLDGVMRPLGSGAFGISRLPTLLRLLRVNIDAKGGEIEPSDGKFSLRCDDAYYDVRVSIVPSPDAAETAYGYATLRFLPKDTKVRSLADLQLAKDDTEALSEMLDKPHGIILVTGPTGSGKTTTLNSLIQTLNKGTKPGEEGTLKIMTIEDPVEYVIDGIQQVNASEKMTFAEAIRRFLRHDPDVILVGEIRDNETAQAAISAARSGHLVFSTLHTNGAAESVARLRNLGIPSYDLDGPLVALVAQRLVRRLCTQCKTKVPVAQRERARFERAKIAPIPSTIFAANHDGCPQCNRGYSGRFPVLEIVKVNGPVSDAIKDGLAENDLRKVCRNEGFRGLAEQALIKVAAGLTSFDAAMELESDWS